MPSSFDSRKLKEYRNMTESTDFDANQERTPDESRSESSADLQSESPGESETSSGEVDTAVEIAENAQDAVETSDQTADSSREADITRTDRVGTARRNILETGTLSRVSLGSALLAVDALNERIDRVEESQERAPELPRAIDSVLVPVSEWEERFGESPGLASRHLAIGMVMDASSSASKGIRFLNNIGNGAVRLFETFFGPIYNSRPFRPAKRGFDKAVARGERQVGYWMSLGRTEDVRSRATAERAITQVADESMDEIVESERIQEFIQEMMAAQSLGIVDEGIEEIRERTVSSDTFFELPFRRLLRRPHRDTIPAPVIDPRIVRPIGKKIWPHDEESLQGYYAGFTSRMLALAVDVAIIMLFAAVTGWLLQTIGQLLGSAPSFESLKLAEDIASAVGIILSSLNAVTVVILYAFVFWTLTGQTPGMMLLGLRVVTDKGEHMTLWHSLLRLIGFVISIIFFFIGFIWVLIDDRRQGWHDKIGRTYVIYAWDAHPDETFLTYRRPLGR
jgi:uncharacterized RDD family membrane protein YckC